MQRHESAVEKSPQMRGPGLLSRKAREGTHGPADGLPAHGAAREMLQLQRRYGNRHVQRVVAVARQAVGDAAGGELDPEVESSIQRARGGGQALDGSVRAQMEPALGADLSGVRVHTGGEADRLNQAVSARAFTTGKDVFFRQGEYSPGSSAGRELLAHELTHVVQQDGAPVQAKLALGAVDTPEEHEADEVARQVMRGETAVQRKCADCEKEQEGIQRKAASRSGSTLQRKADETERTKKLRSLLQDDNEPAAVALMGVLDASEKELVLGSEEFKNLAIEAFNDREMFHAVKGMKGALYPSLRWMFEEGTNWRSVREILTSFSWGKYAVRTDDWMKHQFVDICDDEEMAEAVDLLEGRLIDKLEWMVAEGTNAGLVYDKIRRAPDPELTAVRNDEESVLTGLQRELSKSAFQRVQQMVSGGLLYWEDIDKKVKEQHYEQKDATSPWKLETFRWTSSYEIRYTRSALRLVVRIQLKGQATTPAQRNNWVNGIKNRWDNKFHLVNGHRLAVVVDPVFTSDDEHHKVEVHASGTKACTRENMTNWCATSTGDTVAHEFGHMVGLEDEYRLTAADYLRLTGKAPPAGGAAPPGYTEPGLMHSGSGDVQGRHLAPFVQWLNAHLRPGDTPYRLVAGP